jgi:hypothetical protein
MCHRNHRSPNFSRGRRKPQRGRWPLAGLARIDDLLDAAVEIALQRAAALRRIPCTEGAESAELVIRAALDETDRMRADW